ncbi:hypothetical protein [Sutcliffiella deserti]|uniref:hypothetical protein n=1 Tax=Sutcliffiella deserti TaxID=2875501 RepID=UPI001CBE8081|nr:hypothetical protein [Sutcliffiella deserti]
MKNYEKKHYFVVMAIATVVLSPIIIGLMPTIIQGILYDDRTVWLVKTPLRVYTYFSIACVIFFLGSLAAYFFYSKKIWIALGGFVLAFVFIVIGSLNYMIIGEDGIAWHDYPVNEEKSYGWQEVEKVLLVIDDETDEHSYELYFKDSEMLALDRKGMENLNSQLLQLRKIYGFTYTRQE